MQPYLRSQLEVVVIVETLCAVCKFEQFFVVFPASRVYTSLEFVDRVGQLGHFKHQIAAREVLIRTAPTQSLFLQSRIRRRRIRALARDVRTAAHICERGQEY